MPHIDQPNAARMPAEVLEGVLASLSLCGACAPKSIIHRDQFSNDFAEIHLANGTALVVKRGRFDWARVRFDSSRAASRLIRRETSLVVPNPLPLPEELSDPVEAYWRIDLPTLLELWPEMTPAERAESLHSWGEVAGELHSIELTGFGPLSAGRRRTQSLAELLHGELIERLLPAVIGEWPDA